MVASRQLRKFRVLTPEEKELSRRVQFARENQRYTQAQVAKQIGLSRDQVASIEAERVALRFVSGWKLCQFLNVNPAWLATGQGRHAPFTRFDLEGAGFIPEESLLYLEGYGKVADLYQPFSKEPDPSIFDSSRPDITEDLYVEHVSAFTRLWLEDLPKKHWGQLFYNISHAATSFIDEVNTGRKKPAKR